MRKVIIGILMSFCLFGMYQSLWANHSMHPLKQIAFVKKMIGRKQEPYHTAYVQLIRYADSIQQVTHHARNELCCSRLLCETRRAPGQFVGVATGCFCRLLFCTGLPVVGERKGMEKKRVIL